MGPEKPSKAGKTEDWKAYADSLGLVHTDMKRDQIIELVEAYEAGDFDKPSSEETAEDEVPTFNIIVEDTEPLPVEGGDSIKIKFLDSGLTALSRTFNKGDVLELTFDSQDYERTKNIHGDSWLDLAGDPEAQVKRWGRPMFVETE